MIWTFTATPDQAFDALRAEVPPQVYRELERTIQEAAAGLTPDLYEWTASLTRYGPTLQVEAARARVANRHVVVKKRTPSPFIDTRHG